MGIEELQRRIRGAAANTLPFEEQAAIQRVFKKHVAACENPIFDGHFAADVCVDCGCNRREHGIEATYFIPHTPTIGNDPLNCDYHEKVRAIESLWRFERPEELLVCTEKFPIAHTHCRGSGRLVTTILPDKLYPPGPYTVWAFCPTCRYYKYTLRIALPTRFHKYL